MMGTARGAMALLVLMLCVAAGAQVARPSPSASTPGIKAAVVRRLCAHKGRGGGCDPRLIAPPIYDPTRFVCQFCQVGEMLCLALDVEPTQIKGGPGWLFGDEYRVEIVSTEPATRAQQMKMLLTVLNKAFDINYQMREEPSSVFRLSVGKGGPKFKPTSAPRAETLGDFMGGTLRYSSVGQLVHLLNSIYYNGEPGVRHPVEDGTGLTGRYDIVLNIGTGHAVGAVNLIPLLKEQLNLVATVVPGHATYVAVSEGQYRYDKPWTYP